MISYLRTHWAGQQTLHWSFWINFALLCVTINLVEPLIRPSASDRSWSSLTVAFAYLIVGHLLIYPWQVVGVARACNQHLKRSGDFIMVMAAQGAIVVSLIAGLITASATLYSIFGSPSETAVEVAVTDAQARIPTYVIELVPERSLVKVDGEFDVGLTRDLRELLTQTPDVEGIVLNSDGGRIFEARGVAKLIGENRLETYVDRMCQSACTTAFIAGAKRFLGADGRLGFHRYRLGTVLPFIDVEAEQERDRAFYRSQGVAPTLLSRVFSAPHQSMWYPDIDELLEANVVHRIIDSDLDRKD